MKTKTDKNQKTESHNADAAQIKVNEYKKMLQRSLNNFNTHFPLPLILIKFRLQVIEKE